MVAPKPVSLTQVDAASYDGAFDPEPLLIVGPVPGGGGGGGGGAVDSVNGKTGAVTLDLQDIVGDAGITTGAIGVANNLSSPTQTVVVQPTDITVRDTSTSGSVSITPGDIYVSAGGNRARLTAPVSGGTAIVVTLPSTTGTMALVSDVESLSTQTTSALAGKASTTDLDNVFTIATEAVPQSRTISGKPLSSDITLTKIDVGLASVDNTSDANKPVSVAQQTALDAKAPLASPAFTGTPTGITKAHVGLSNVDNTSDANKPVSTAQASAIAAKVGSANSSVTGIERYATVGDLPATGTVGVIYVVDAV